MVSVFPDDLHLINNIHPQWESNQALSWVTDFTEKHFTFEQIDLDATWPQRVSGGETQCWIGPPYSSHKPGAGWCSPAGLSVTRAMLSTCWNRALEMWRVRLRSWVFSAYHFGSFNSNFDNCMERAGQLWLRQDCPTQNAFLFSLPSCPTPHSPNSITTAYSKRATRTLKKVAPEEPWETAISWWEKRSVCGV